MRRLIVLALVVFGGCSSASRPTASRPLVWSSSVRPGSALSPLYVRVVEDPPWVEAQRRSDVEYQAHLLREGYSVPAYRPPVWSPVYPTIRASDFGRFEPFDPVQPVVQPAPFGW